MGSSTRFAVLLLVILSVISLSSCQTPPIPTLPRSFATDFTFSLNIFNGDYPLLQGHFAIDYDGLGGMLYFEDSPDGAVPYVLQTSIIGHPLAALQESMGYNFLSEGRCWIVGYLPADYFHYVPLAIPPTATFLGNSTINGDVCSQWTWTSNVDNLFPLTFILIVRYEDNAPLYFVIDNTFFFSFRITIKNSRFFLNPSKTYFNVPPGPCVNKSWNEPEPKPKSTFSEDSTPKNGFEMMGGFMVKKLLSLYTSKTGLLSMLLGNVQPKQTTVRQEVTRHKRASAQNPPTPPTLHQYFQSDYEIGYGELSATNGYLPPNSLFQGNMAVDKQSGGFYINIDDDQDNDVPWLFSTSVILTPNPDGTTAGYWYLRPGRCWLTGYPLVNPDFPIEIPANATFIGKKTIYGKDASIWEFDGSFEGYDAAIQICVNNADNTIIFITLSPDFENLPLGTYLIFRNFNASKPDPATYAPPPGHCWDPVKGGPGTK